MNLVKISVVKFPNSSRQPWRNKAINLLAFVTHWQFNNKHDNVNTCISSVILFTY